MPQILLVEDEPVVQDAMRRALAGRGYHVLTASDGATALKLTDQASPALIILDIYLPIVDGREFVRLYQQRPEPRAAILVMTGKGYAAQRAAALDAAGYLAKPFTPQELLATVEAVLGPSRVGSGT